MRELELTLTSKIEQDGEEEIQQSNYFATMKSGRKKFIQYEERLDQDTTDVVLVIGDQSVRMNRSGQMNVKLLFEPGHYYETFYHYTSYKIPIKIYTYDVLIKQRENESVIEIKYDLYERDEIISNHHILFQLKEQS